MIAFEYATAGRIVFGRGSYSKLPDIVAEHGARPMYITGSRRRESGTSLSQASRRWNWSGKLSDSAGNGGFDCVVGVGGGSVIDAAKATAVLAANDGDVLDYLEVIGAGKTLSKPGLPCIAVPTTAGTGTEVTRNAVIGSPEHGVKASLRSSYLLPKVAVVDPELTLDLPREITANTGLDALTQLIEAFLSVRANAFTDALLPRRNSTSRRGTAARMVEWRRYRSPYRDVVCCVARRYGAGECRTRRCARIRAHRSGACSTMHPTELSVPPYCRTE